MVKHLLFPVLAAALSCSAAFAQAEETKTTTTETTSSTTEEPQRKSAISPGGLFLEPILTASREDAEIKTSQLPAIADDTTGNTEGYGVGAKLGVHVSEIFFLGADARYAKLKFQDSSYQSADGDSYNYGPTAGLQMPILGLRLFGTYVMGGEFNPGSGAQGVDLKFREARGPRYGVGVHVAAVSVNLEYQDLVYDKTDVQSFGSLPGNADTNVDFENKGYTLSLSFPLEF